VDTDHLKIFVEIVKQGSFAAAARRLDLDPSVATRAIAALEKELGSRLMERTSRHLVLTETGRFYHERACHLVQDLQQAADEARDLTAEPSGVVRVTASVTYGHAVVLPLLQGLHKAHPGLEVDLQLSDSNVDLIRERVDFALRLRQEMNTALVGTRLARIRYYICATPTYLRKEGAPSAPAEMAKRDCLRCSRHGHRAPWKFRDLSGSNQEVEVRGWLVVSNSLALHRAALDGLGPAMLPDWLAAGDLSEGRLVDLFPGHEATPNDFDNAVWMLYASRAYLPRRVTTLMNFIKQRIRDTEARSGLRASPRANCGSSHPRAAARSAVDGLWPTS
jgi:DNA-binding transcriptional LysR family regulator